MERPEAIVLKIIGVTVSLDFRNFLIGYFITQLSKYLKARWGSANTTKILEQLRKVSIDYAGRNCPQILAIDQDEEAVQKSVVDYCAWAVKSTSNTLSTPLNDLQGQVWAEGFKNHSIQVP